MPDTFDPDERFTVPEGTEPDEVLRRLLAEGNDEADPEPEDEPEGA